MTVEERIDAADRRRAEGNQLFKDDKIEPAIQQYEMVMSLFNVVAGFFLRRTCCFHVRPIGISRIKIIRLRQLFSNMKWSCAFLMLLLAFL